MEKHRITFLPDEKAVEVAEETTIAEAAQRVGVHINNLCGGQGVCGECRVLIKAGNAKAGEKASAFFSREEIEKGYVLACQTPVRDDLEVLIPPDSRIEEAKILTGEGSETSGGAESQPLVRKIYLELPPPTLEDNISDIERISRALRKKLGWHSYEISLFCLQRLSDNLRDHDWKVTATVVKDKKGYRIIKIDPSDTTSRNFGVALDIGTTTVVAQLVDINSSRVIGVEGAHNLQAGFGEDVISRMIYACGKNGLTPLQEAVVKNINQLIEKLTQEKKIPLDEINAIVAAGNTTMSHFLLGLTPCSIRLDPYVPTADVYPQILAKDIGIHINPNGILETIPSVASYVERFLY